MKRCQFYKISDTQARCSVCGVVFPTGGFNVDQIHRECAKPPSPCTNCGDPKPATTPPKPVRAAPSPTAVPVAVSMQQNQVPQEQLDYWPRDEDGYLIPKTMIKEEDLPCPYREESLRTEYCQLCGQKDRTFVVYKCSKKSECCLIPSTKIGPSHIVDCLHCELRRQ